MFHLRAKHRLLSSEFEVKRKSIIYLKNLRNLHIFMFASHLLTWEKLSISSQYFLTKSAVACGAPG